MIFGISAFNYLLSAEFQLKSEGTVGGLPSLDSNHEFKMCWMYRIPTGKNVSQQASHLIFVYVVHCVGNHDACHTF